MVAASATRGRESFGHGPEANTLHLHPATGKETAQRLAETKTRSAAGEPATTAGRGFDFSRIPGRAAAPGRFQTKLALGRPGDAYEQEADRVAEQVMRMPEPLAPMIGYPKHSGGHDDHERVQTMRVQAIDFPVTEVSSTVHEGLRSPGEPLERTTRAFMESRFGQDFSGVRVHTDARAVQSARDIDALAYTVRRDMVFGAGQYAPASATGRHLLAHELAHVSQQVGANASGVRTVQRQALSQDETTKEGDGGGSAKNESSRVTATIEIVSGSKPAPGQAGEKKIYGGKKGGHVVINLGDAGVLGFSNDEYGGHWFPKQKGKRNAKFEHYTQEQWQKKTEGKQVVTFKIEISPAQEKAIKDAFEGEPEVDYSVLGYRCASYALRTLDQAGIIDRSDFMIKYVLAVTPASLIRFLEKQGYSPKFKEGSKKRKWNRRFKMPEAKPAPSTSE